VLKLSETDADRITAKSRIALLAMLQGRYPQSAALYKEVAAYYKGVGSIVDQQVNQLEHARALTMTGHLDDADAVLRSVREAAGRNVSVFQTVEHYQSNLDFQRSKFDQAISRLERMRSAADKAGQTVRSRDLRLELCTKTGEAGRFSDAATICPPLLRELKDSPARLIAVYDALSAVGVSRGRFTEAINHSREAVRLAGESGNKRHHWYSLLFLASALKQAGNEDWKSVRKQAHSILEEISREGSPADMNAYLKRPLIARRWNAINLLN
jgi:tetratricopeptide (TPR) repeat protein